MMEHRRLLLAIGAAVFTVVSAPVQLLAQQAEGTLAGNVLDQTGQTVPDADGIAVLFID